MASGCTMFERVKDVQYAVLDNGARARQLLARINQADTKDRGR